jgi:hypothetical protein
VTTARGHHSSVYVDVQNPVLTNGQTSLMPNRQFYKPLRPVNSSLFPPSHERRSSKLICYSALIICLVTALSSPVKPHSEGSSLTLDSAFMLKLLSRYNFYPHSLGCLQLLHNINKWNWFRPFVVPEFGSIVVDNRSYTPCTL